ncbi:MAG: ATP phosphoribosyltransferase [Tannerellaceae bacterium]|jgi:ATP phosphoribosyltransferase|nr:ATP phosphoribosyltransferase [Tannerellaceae bacterium]
MLRIAIQAKGRLYEETMTLLAGAGIKLNKEKRTLLVSASGLPIEILFMRDDDIPAAVYDKVADAGIVGENEYVEKGSEALLVKRLGFSKCRLALAIPKEDDYEGLQWFEAKVIATSYPAILKNFLAKRGIKAQVHVIGGSVEIAPAIGIAQAIFDIVGSGDTLTSNNLKMVETVMHSEAVLIASHDLSPEKDDILNKLIFRIDAVVAAESKKYVLLNAPKAALENIIQLLPGMKSPTVTPLADNGWVSIQSVIDEADFWERIGKLKALGAEGILVIPIEKMIL